VVLQLGGWARCWQLLTVICFDANHEHLPWDLHSSPNIVRVTKIEMRWAGHVARMVERRGFWRGNMRVRDHLGDPGVDGRIILR